MAENLTNRDRRAHKEAMDSVRDLLARRYPLCFAPKGHKRRPLALGIHDVLLSRDLGGLSGADLMFFLHSYTSAPQYLKAVIHGTHRVGLDGRPAGEIDERAKVRASIALAKIDKVEQAHDRLKDARAESERLRQSLAHLVQTLHEDMALSDLSPILAAAIRDAERVLGIHNNGANGAPIEGART